MESENIENIRIEKTAWEKFSRYIIMALAVFLPVWILPVKGFTLGFSKSLLVFVFVLAAAVFYLIHLLQKGSINYPRSIAFLALLAILLVGIVSSLFSGTIQFSLFGTGGETGTLFFLFALFVILFLTALLFQSEKDALILFFLFTLSSIIVFVYQLFHSVFGLTLFRFLLAKTDTLIGSWNELGIFFGFIALMAIIFLEFFSSRQFADLQTERKWRIFLFFIVGISLLVMAFVNFTAGWVVFALLLLIFFVYLFSSFGNVRNFASLPFFIILLSLFFILTRPLTGDIVSSMDFNFLEVRPSWTATAEVVKGTLTEGVKNIALGSGPNTFVYDWLKFKPLSINQTMFWDVRFQYGIGLIPSFAATIGIWGILAFLIFLAALVYYGLRVISYSGNNITKSLLFSSFLGSVYLWIFNIIYVPGHFLLVLSFMVTGLFFALLVKSGILNTKEFCFASRTSLGFISSLFIVLLIITSISAFYLIFQKYWAVYSYGKGLAAFNAEGNLQKAQNYFVKAARFDKQDRYYRALGEIGLVHLSSFLNQQDSLSQEEALSQFQNTFASVIQNTQTAAQLNSVEPLNWIALGRVYESIIPFNIDGARAFALDAYKTASETSPFDPEPLLASARVEIQSGDNESARSFLDSSLKLKSNYTPALFLLARIAAQEGDLDSAIKQAEMARLTAPNDVGVLFQLGLLYYQNKDYRNTMFVLERAVSISPNYSNASYFLGLSYDKEGKRKEAIGQFEKIQSLNPGNEEVRKILLNLKAGRSALSEISPPKPAPEEREEPPIEEE